MLEAGIPEVWLVNLDEESIEVYCRPSPDGCRETRALRRGQQLFAAVLAIATACEWRIRLEPGA